MSFVYIRGRIAQSTAALSILRALKLIRLVRLMHVLQTQHMFAGALRHANFGCWRIVLFDLVQGYIAFVILVHFNAVLWASQQSHTSWDTDSDAIKMYWSHFCKMFTHLSVGGNVQATTQGQELLLVVMAIERTVALICVSTWLMWNTLLFAQGSADLIVLKESAMAYLQRHGVSKSLQSKIFQSLHETGGIRMERERFDRLAKIYFSPKLEQTICQELWGQRLLSHDLILRLADWHADLVQALAALVREDVVASNTVLFCAGDPSNDAYLLLQGVLTVTFHEYDDNIPDYMPGMWIGDQALVNPSLKRVETVVCKAWCDLMVLPAAAFRKLLSTYDLKERFETLLQDELWVGLCGHCGTLGDHFPHDCPLTQDMFASESRSFLKASGFRNNPSQALLPRLCLCPQGKGHESRHRAKKDLIKFLSANQLDHLLDHLVRQGVTKLDDLKLVTIDQLRSDPEVCLTPQSQRALSLSAIQSFKKSAAFKATQFLAQQCNTCTHFMFLSHCKAEAASTAVIMQENLLRMLQQDPQGRGQDSDVPVFLDSDHLADLQDLRST